MRISDWSSDVCSSDLPPRIAARHVAVAEQAGHGLAVDRLRNVLIVGGQAVVAGRILVLAAMEAASAGYGEGHDHPLPLLQGRSRPGLHNFAHEFMAPDRKSTRLNSSH